MPIGACNPIPVFRYCSVVTAKLNGKRLLFSGEVDCMAMANGGVGTGLTGQ